MEINSSLSWCFLRLVTIQSCILDNESSLFDIVQEIDAAIKEDPLIRLVCFCFFHIFPGLKHDQKREISEREAALGDLKTGHERVIGRLAQSMYSLFEFFPCQLFKQQKSALMTVGNGFNRGGKHSLLRKSKVNK